jgi:two-component system sensor histidine kinase AlgZ
LVTVIIKELAGKLQIDITNPIAVDDHSRQPGNRMALENIRHRLQAVYGSEAEIITVQDDEF